MQIPQDTGALGKKRWLTILFFAMALALIMPLPRLNCFDGCSWPIASLVVPFPPINTIIAWFGLFLLWPLVVPFVLYTTVFFLLLLSSSFLRIRSKLLWRTSVVVVAILGTIIIGFVASFLIPEVKSSYLTEYSRYWLRNAVEFGMTKIYLKEKYPNLVKDTTEDHTTNYLYPWDFHSDDDYSDDPFISTTGVGSDCWRLNTLSICFKDDLVFAIGLPQHSYTARFYLHDDYVKTLRSYDFTKFETCKKLANEAPYFMGYFDEKTCEKIVARNISQK